MSLFLEKAGRAFLVGAGRPLLLAGAAASGMRAGGSTARVTALVIGQSNAAYGFADMAWATMAQGAAWYLGTATSAGAATGAVGSTMIGGEGLYTPSTPGYTGSFLNDPGDGSSPAAWGYGSPDGAALLAYLNGLSAAQRSAINAILLPWSETDSYRAYAEKATYKAAAIRFLSLVRGTLGKTAAQLPVLWWGLPFGTAPGWAMTQEVRAELAADPAQNVIVGVPQTADSIWRDASYDPTTGLFSGGVDNIHRAATDNLRAGQRGAIMLARAVMAAQALPPLSSVLPTRGGPVMIAARLSGVTVTVTVQHDAGTDLRLPLQAVNGIGFSVMDGGSFTGTPGPIIPAIKATYLSPTSFALTLAQAPSSSAAQCRLFYPFQGIASVGPQVGQQNGVANIGRGDAITDNYSAIAKPVSADIAAALGPSAASWGLDYPLQSPVTVSGGVASAGLALS